MSLSERVLGFLKTRKFATNVEIARALDASPAQVSSVTGRLMKAGRLQRKSENPYLYSLSKEENTK